jgi:hypothetical protein
MSLLASLNRSAAVYGISGPLWFRFSQDFALAFSSWLNSPLVLYRPQLSLAKAGPPVAVGVAVAPAVFLNALATSRFAGTVANGPLGIKTEAALIQGINLLPCGVKPLGIATGSGPTPVLPGGSFVGPSLSSYLLAISSVNGATGRAWLLDFGTRLQAGLSLSGGVVVSPVPPVPAPPVVLSLGCVCPL